MAEKSIVKPAVKESAPVAPPKIPAGIDPDKQFQAAPFDAVRGNASGSQHKAAPAHANGGNPAMPGSTPLVGHSPADPRQVGAHMPGQSVLSGNHNPVRSKGRATKPGDARDLSTAGA
jgi:hypothetical protein